MEGPTEAGRRRAEQARSRHLNLDENPLQGKRRKKMTAIQPREIMDETQMAEYQETANARAEGFALGLSEGLRRGLAAGIAGAAFFFILVYAIGKIVGLT
jgi:flagellar biosynthesis/type III secretory pathway protein FliH